MAFSPDGTRLATGDNDCKVRLWDARPWTPEAAIEREALGLLDSLFARPLRKADVIDYLRNAPTIRPRARQLALSLVDRYHEETNPETYHRASWAIVRQPYLNAVPVSLRPAPGGARLPPGSRSAGVSHRPRGGPLPRRPIPARRSRPWGEPIGSTRVPRRSWPSWPWPITSSGTKSRRGPTSLACGRASTSLQRTEDAETLDLMHEAEALISSQATAIPR